MTHLVQYDAACAAVAACKTVDEAKEILNRAEAARAYARQAKNRQMELDAIEIRVRAERRLGEIIIQLKQSDKIVVQGVRSHTERGKVAVTLSDLGISKKDSAPAQRLAQLPEARFNSEIEGWRRSSENQSRLETPLQRYRVPSLKASNERIGFVRFGRRKVDDSNPLDRFRAIDGRRIADWRYGELDRIEQLSRRMLRFVDVLKANIPVANPDPLSTMEMIFHKVADLQSLLASVADEIKVDPGKTGLDSARIDAARKARQRICEGCRETFAAKRSDSRFCCRKCALASRH